MKRTLDFEAIYANYAKRIAAPQPRCELILLKGRIIRGDFERVKALLDRNPLVRSIYLWSPGGDLTEAMQIGSLVRERLLDTVAPFSATGWLQWHEFNDGRSVTHEVCRGRDCICASACVAIWAGGIDRGGDALGLHRPSFDEQYFSSLSPKEAQVRYAAAMTEAKRYFAQMEFSAHFVGVMLSTPKQQLYAYGKNRRDDDLEDDGYMEGCPLSICEWIAASCDTLTFAEAGELIRLQVTRANGTPAKASYLDYLEKKSFYGNQCSNWVIMAAREKLR